MSTSNCCNCAAEADTLSKYESLYPKSFIECVRQGCTWLANHNNITYQTSTLVRTDAAIYSTSGSGVLKVGLIDTDKPTSGLTQYDVSSVTESKDSVSGSTIYTVKCSYKTPMGLTVTLIPVVYFDPNEENNNKTYSITEVDALIAKLQEQITALTGEKKDETDTPDVAAVYATEDFVNNKLADYALLSNLNQQVAVLTNKIDNIQVGGGLDLSEYAKTTEVETKIQAAIADIPASDLTEYAKSADVTDQLELKANTSDLDLYLKIADIATTPELKGEKGDTGEQGPAGTDGTSPTAQEVADVLKADDTFKASVKGDAGQDADVSTLATKAELVDYLKTTDADDKYATKTELGEKVSTTVFEAYKGTVYTKEQADAAFQAK